MKHKTKDYAKAFLATLEQGVGEKEASAGLLRSIIRNGDRSASAKIIEEVEKELVKKSGGRLVKIEFGRAMGASERAKMLEQFNKKDRVVTRVSPELIAGTRITINEERELDFSLAGKLNTLLK